MALMWFGNKDLEGIGLAINEEREKKNLRQNYMVDEIGVGNNVIHKIENGKGSLEAEYLLYISQMLGKAIEKKIKEEQKIARETARCERATQIVGSACYMGNFRVLDPDAEIVLSILLQEYDGNDNNRVSFYDASFPSHIQNNLALEFEKLQQYGMICESMMYGTGGMVTLSTQGKIYFEEKEDIIRKSEDDMKDSIACQDQRNQIFISHRTVDAGIADMIKDFLVSTGVPNEKIFCSSLPGNDVNEKISPEVKTRLKKASIIILILSKDYYESAYCINEAGVSWYLDDVVTSIPFGMPEIDYTDMIGFFNSDYKLRRLDIDGDISYLYDTAHEKMKSENVKVSVITRETQKLKERYSKYIESRVVADESFSEVSEEDMSEESANNISTNTYNIELSTDAALLLVYATSDPYGQIMHIRTLGGDSIGTAGFEFILDNTAKETARWTGALEELERYRLVKAAGSKRQVFRVTREGFSAAGQLKNLNPDIDTSLDPEQYLKNDEY